MDILELNANCIKHNLDLVVLYSRMSQAHAENEEFEEALFYDQKAMASLEDAMHIIKKYL